MNELIKTLVGVHRHQPSFQANFSRRKATWIAEAASRGLITCLSTGLNQQRWLMTAKGLRFLQKEGAA